MSFTPVRATNHGNENSPSTTKAKTDAILRATLEELAAVGYTALSIEAVAERVGIAKTTVYRRYPTKTILIRAAIENFLRADKDPPNTGTLRGDLIAVGQMAAGIASSTLGKSLFRLGIESPDPELRELVEHADASTSVHNTKVAQRAQERGEIRNPMELERVIEILLGTIFFKLLCKRRQVDEAEIGSIVDTLLLGALRPTGTGQRRRRSAT
jgi:AcrR family transcriptional regulator